MEMEHVFNDYVLPHTSAHATQLYSKNLDWDNASPRSWRAPSLFLLKLRKSLNNTTLLPKSVHNKTLLPKSVNNKKLLVDRETPISRELPVSYQPTT